MKVISLPQRSDEWLRWRTGGVSASEASVLLGISPYKTLWRLWAEKTGRAKEEDISRNPNVIRGVENEDRARQCAEYELNGDLLLPVCAESDDHPLIRASLDGLSSAGIPVELKCPCESQWNDVITNAEQSEGYATYYPQVQQQILVTEAPYGHLLFYSPEDNGDYRIFKIPRDDVMIQQIIDKTGEFWKHVAKDTPPEMDPKRDLFIPEDDDLVNEWIFNATNYRLLDQQIKELKAKLEDLEQRRSRSMKSMEDSMGDFLRADFAGVNITRFEKSGAVDYKKYLADKLPDFDESELEAYRRPSSQQTRVTVTNNAMPKNIIDTDVQKSVEHVEEGRLKTAYF